MSASDLLSTALFIGIVCSAQSHVTLQRDTQANNLDTFDGLDDARTDWTDPMTYLIDVTNIFSDKLHVFGVHNLPLDDVITDVNATRYNIPLLGQLSYTDGVVLSIHNITMYNRDYIWYIEDTEAVLLFKIALLNISIDFDLHAALEVADVTGKAGLVYPENILAVKILNNFTSGDISVAYMYPSNVRGPLTDFTPDSDVMSAVAYHARLTMAAALFDQFDSWIEDTLQQLLQDTLDEMPFPISYTDGWANKT